MKKEAALLEALIGLLIAKITAGIYSSVAKKVKRLAVKHLDNQFILNYIASHDSDSQLRGQAASKLLSPTLLRKLLLKEKDEGVRIAVLSKLRTADILREFRRPQIGRGHKLQLVSLVKTQEGLYDLLREENDKGLVIALLKGITSPKIIARLRSLSHPLVREWVKEKEKLWERRKSDEASVLDSVLKEANPNSDLLLQVQSPKTWYLIAKRHKNPEVQMDAVVRLEGNKELLVKLEGDKKLLPLLRLRAAFLLGGTKTVSDIALTDPNPEMRLRAVALLDPKRNASTISTILKEEKRSNVLTQAILVTTSTADLDALRERINPEVSPRLLKILEERESVLAKPKSEN